MPAIPRYQQRTQAQAGLGAGPEFVSSGIGEGLMAIADANDFLRQKEERAKEEDAATWATERLSGLQSEWTADLQNRKESAEPGAPQFTEQVLKDYDARLADAV